MNQHLFLRLKAIQQALLANAAGNSGLPTAMLGSEREVFIREFLQLVFPAHRRFSTGAITDASGNLTGQVDIAVEYGHFPSFPMPGGNERLLLAESVALVIEVKSDIASQWDQVESTTQKVKALRRELRSVLTLGRRPSTEIPVIAVGYRGYKNLAALKNRLERTREDSRPDAALVIESGAFVSKEMQASGPLSLYALCATINSELDRVGIAQANLIPYVQIKTAESTKPDNAD